MKAVRLKDGIVTECRPLPLPGVEWVSGIEDIKLGDTTPDNGVTFYRNGQLLRAPVPEEVPLWAFRASLVLGGITQAQVDSLIESLPDPSKTVASIQWNYGNFIERGHALIGQLGAQLGLSSDQIDDVFRTADSLK